MISLICGIKEQKKGINKTETDSYTEDKLVIARGEGGQGAL